MAKASGRVTIRHVAKHAGVSVTTVSKVLRDAPGASEPVRQRIRASMATLGYRPHAAARGMRGQTYALGILLPDLNNPFFAHILAGVTTALERTPYQTLIGVSQVAEANELSLVESMIDRQMDGLLLVGPRISPDEIGNIAQRVPTSVIGMHAPTATQFDTVNNDDHLGATLAIDHLAAAGYRRIAMLSLTTRRSQVAVTVDREAGYRSAMAAHGLARHVRVVSATHTAREIHAALLALLKDRRRPDAIFCWSDLAAKLALSVAEELKLSVPGDLALVGYDNTADCDLAQNSLTSIDQSGEVLGLQAARLLVERIKGRTEPTHLVVLPRLVARRSSEPRAH